MLNDLEVLWVARYDYKPQWKLKKHKHNYYQIIFCIDGKGIFYLNEIEYSMISGSVFLLHPNSTHGLIVTSKNTLKTLDIKFYVNSIKLEQILKGQCKNVSLNIPQVGAMIEKIRNEGINKNPFYKEFSTTYLMHIILTIIREQENKAHAPQYEISPSQNNECEVCQKFSSFIQKHFADSINLDIISNSIGYNKSYICRCVKKNFFCSPMQYLYHLRIKKSKELILYSDYSLKEIANMVGFKNVHHFSRLFKQFEGITPGSWRNKEKEGVHKDIYLSKNFINLNYTDKTH